MENFRNRISKFLDQAGSFWGSLSVGKKFGVAAVVASILAVITALSLTHKSDPYEYLFVNISAEDSQAISSFLKKNGMNDFIIDSRGVKVTSKNVLPYRLKLTQEGLPTHGQVGWEKFDSSDFTRTGFERKIHKVRAIQGELARTITAITGIASARVHIVSPQQRLFEKDQKKPTAAIYIKTTRGASLSKKQIQGIVHLVSKSVEGLPEENISIIDFEGKLLTEERSKDPTSRETKEMIEFKRSKERLLEQKIRSIIGRIVGQDRVEAKVDVNMDFTKEEQTISDLDPDKVVVLSQNTTNQKTEGSGLNPTGIPGSKSNVPGEQEALNLSTSKAQNTRDTELINYEIAKTVSHKVLPIGKIKRISAAVIVDGSQATPADGSTPDFEPRTKEEMAKIEELVRSAIGFVEGRDEVKVHNLMFQLDYIQVEALNAEKQEKRDYISTLSISAVVALSLVLFFSFIVRPYFRWLTYDPERKERQAIVEEFKPDLEMSGIQNVQITEDVPFEKLSPQEQVMYVARHDPMRTTEALRSMLNPHSN